MGEIRGPSIENQTEKAEMSEAMSSETVQRAGETGSRLPLVLWSATGMALVAAGFVLWSARADAVFLDLLSAAIAWCM